MSDERSIRIPTNLRPLAVLEAVANAGVPLTPTEANVRLGLPKPTVHRLFQMLESEGFLRRDVDGRSYAPAPRLHRLGTGLLSSLGLASARQAILRKLSVEIGETCNIALPDRDAMLYLERVETEWPLRIQLPVGTRVPLHCTASGKLYLSALGKRALSGLADSLSLEARTSNSITNKSDLLSEVSRIREDGYALDREEFMPDMVALAVPVRDSQGRLMVTLSFHAPTQRFTADRTLEHLPDLLSAAKRLSHLAFED